MTSTAQVDETIPSGTAGAIRAWFAEDPSRMTMMAARRFQVPEREVVDLLVGQWPIVRLRPDAFPELLAELPGFGVMRVFVRSRAAVMESVGQFGGISETGPFVNVQTDSLDMHILRDEVAAIYAVEKVGHDSTITTYSYQFFDHAGQSAFKAFLWEGYPDVPGAHIERFRSLASRFSDQGPTSSDPS